MLTGKSKGGQNEHLFRRWFFISASVLPAARRPSFSDGLLGYNAAAYLPQSIKSDPDNLFRFCKHFGGLFHVNVYHTYLLELRAINGGSTSRIHLLASGEKAS